MWIHCGYQNENWHFAKPGWIRGGLSLRAGECDPFVFVGALQCAFSVHWHQLLQFSKLESKGLPLRWYCLRRNFCLRWNFVWDHNECFQSVLSGGIFLLKKSTRKLAVNYIIFSKSDASLATMTWHAMIGPWIQLGNIQNHSTWIDFRILCFDTISYVHFLRNISWNRIRYRNHTISHMISHVYDVMGPVYESDYDIPCNFICFLVPARACSNAAREGSKVAPIRFRCAPVRIKWGRCSSRTSASVCLFRVRNRVAVVY